jgi:hypothetical protein
VVSAVYRFGVRITIILPCKGCLTIHIILITLLDAGIPSLSTLGGADCVAYLSPFLPKPW